MIYEAEGQLDLDGIAYRSIWVVGNEDELEAMLAKDAREKGWALHRREPGRVQLRKARENQPSEEAESATQNVQVETDEEWRARTGDVTVREGCVICARCRHVDRSKEMEDFVRCGSPKSLSSFVKKHRWVSPAYSRLCDDYSAVTSDETPAGG